MSNQTWKPIPFDTSKNQNEDPSKGRSGSVTYNPGIGIGSGNDSLNESGNKYSEPPVIPSLQDNPSMKRNTSVSFNIPPQSLSQLYHRHSISNKFNQQLRSQGSKKCFDILQKNSLNNLGNIKTSQNKKEEKENNDEEDRDCAVHMPGDFVYIKPVETTTKALETESNILSDGQTNKPKLSNKIVFNKNEYSPLDNTFDFNKEDDNKFHILIGATGSVATIKIPLIIDRLFKIYSHETIAIQLILTKAAEHFLHGLKIAKDVKIWREDDMRSRLWDFNNNVIQNGSMNIITNGKKIRKDNIEPLLFHELSRWADIFLIAPLSANSLAKLANGICNNLLTSVVRDWNIKKTPIVVAPAMNTFMYINPMTKKHLMMLKEDIPTLEILKPVEKVLICGDIGMGGMREWNDIVENIRLKIKEIHRQRHENDKDNEDQELEQIDKDIAADDDDDDAGDEDDDDDDDEDEEETKDVGTDIDSEEEDDDDDDDDFDDEEEEQEEEEDGEEN